MKKKRNLRSEIQKLLRPDKAKKINEEQTELQKNEYAEPDTKGLAEGHPKEQLETEAEESERVEQKEQVKLEAEGLAKVQPEEQAELQINNHIKLGINNIMLSTVKNTRYEIHIQIKPEINISILSKNQPYVNFTNKIMGKYGFERLNSTFSKLIFRQYQMMLKEDRIEANAECNRIINNYNSFFYINRTVFNLIAQSIVSINTKSNKEVRVPFYILKNPLLNSVNESSNGNGYEKEALKILSKSFSKSEQISRKTEEENSVNLLENNVENINNLFKLHYSQKAQQKLIETQKAEILNNTVDRITRIILEPKSKFLEAQAIEKRIKTVDAKIQTINSVLYILSDKSNKPSAKILYDSKQQSKFRASITQLSESISFEKRSLSNRTSIGSNIEIINTCKIGNTDGNINKDIKISVNGLNYWTIYEKDNGSSDRTKNISNSIFTNIYKKNGITNLAINRTINGKTNGSSNKNIKNNDITNRAYNGLLNTTINRNSIGIIHKTVNINTDKVINKLENTERAKGYSQFPLMKNSLLKNEAQVELTELESTEKVEEGKKNSKSENIKNIITNRIDNVAINTTINKNSSGAINKAININSNGIINKAVNIVTNRITNRLGNTEIINRHPQFQLMNNSLVNNEVQVELESPELESVAKDEERQRNIASEDIKQSEIILNTTLTKLAHTPKTKALLKSTLLQSDGEISNIFKNYLNKQNIEGNEEAAHKKNNYQNRTTLLIPAEKQVVRAKGTSNITGKQLLDSSLILSKPHIKETPTASAEVHKNINNKDEQVFAKAVTSSKPQRKYNQIEVEEVNQIAEKVYKIIEKRIAIQKDRRGLR